MTTRTTTRNETPTREVLDRRQQIWGRQPTLGYDEVIELADLELADEAARKTDSERYAREMVDSVRRMTACPVCGSPGRWSAHTALCQPCHRTAETLKAERAAAEIVGTADRRTAVAAYLERTGPQR